MSVLDILNKKSNIKTVEIAFNQFKEQSYLSFCFNRITMDIEELIKIPIDNGYTLREKYFLKLVSILYSDSIRDYRQYTLVNDIERMSATSYSKIFFDFEDVWVDYLVIKKILLNKKSVNGGIQNIFDCISEQSDIIDLQNEIQELQSKIINDYKEEVVNESTNSLNEIKVEDNNIEEDKSINIVKNNLDDVKDEVNNDVLLSNKNKEIEHQNQDKESENFNKNIDKILLNNKILEVLKEKNALKDDSNKYENIKDDKKFLEEVFPKECSELKENKKSEVDFMKSLVLFYNHYFFAMKMNGEKDFFEFMYGDHDSKKEVNKVTPIVDDNTNVIEKPKQTLKEKINNNRIKIDLRNYVKSEKLHISKSEAIKKTDNQIIKEIDNAFPKEKDNSLLPDIDEPIIKK